MSKPDIAIEYLANRPEFIEQLAQLSWKEWKDIYQQRDQTLEHCRKNYRERMNTDCLPLTMVALTDGPPSPGYGVATKMVGMASLKFHDLDTRPDLDPWLGGLFVLPEYRNRGVGTLLMDRATEEARKLNISRLYLWTHTAERLYHRLGWQLVERTDYFGKPAVVMEKRVARFNHESTPSNTNQRADFSP